MGSNLLTLIIYGLIFVPVAGLVAWIVTIENEKFIQKIDRKIADEIMRRRKIDNSYGSDYLFPDITHIRHECKKENRFLFLIVFIASLVSCYIATLIIIEIMSQ